MTGKTLELEFDLHATPEDIKNAYDYKAIPAGAVENAFSRVIPTGQRWNEEQEIQRLSHRAVKRAVSSMLEQGETELNSENLNDFVGQLWEQLQPFALHQVSSQRKIIDASRSPIDDTNDDKTINGTIQTS